MGVSMTQPQIVEFTRRADQRGWLVAIQDGSGLPFEMHRIYFVGGARSGVRRGGHAHHKTNQAALCVSGACTFELDDGRSKATVCLDRPDRALLLPPSLWHEMYDFSEDCVLLVIADRPFDEADYIRSYQQFLELVAG
jgi:dTDP-4-dehydrorhamnose 3,5-epimerase-like enzyme